MRHKPNKHEPPTGWIAMLVWYLREITLHDRWAPTLRVLLILVVVVLLFVAVQLVLPVPPIPPIR